MNALIKRTLAPSDRYGSEEATLPAVSSDGAITIWEYVPGSRAPMPAALIPPLGYVIDLPGPHYAALRYVAELQRQRGNAVDTVSVLRDWLEDFSGGERCEYDPARISIDKADLEKLAREAPLLRVEIDINLAATVAISLNRTQLSCVSERARECQMESAEEFLAGAVFQKSVSALYRLIDDRQSL